MKSLCILLVALACEAALRHLHGQEITNAVQPNFSYEHYDALGGTLKDKFVRSVFISSDNRVWVGTLTGLAVYDGEGWTDSTFRVASHLRPVTDRLAGRGRFRGPEYIAEGPSGTVWLGGESGLWRVREGRYELISSTPEITSLLGMAVDYEGNLWIVEKSRVHKFDGHTWSIVLCPYIGKPVSRESSGLYGIVVATNGNVWIGGTVYGEVAAPWKHEGSSWIVDQERRTRKDGPPMAALFEFDGRGWRAFGAPHGLSVRSATPELDEADRVRVWTTPHEDYYIRDGERWKAIEINRVRAGKHWFLMSKGGYGHLRFRDAQDLVDVRARHFQSGRVLDLSSKPFGLLCMAEDTKRSCVWLGTTDGLYRIWCEQSSAQ